MPHSGQLPRPPNGLMRALYEAGLGPVIGRVVLLLTTTGRKTGQARVTPLQYEIVDGAVYVASAWGPGADWVRNLRADPQVGVRLGRETWPGRAEVTTDPARIADFLELRLRRHPRMIGLIMRLDGLPAHPSRADLLAYAARLALVIIRREPSSH